MALIDSKIARTLFNELKQLRETLEPQIRDLTEAATTAGVSMGRDTAEAVLDVLQQRISQVIDIVDKNSPGDVKP